MHCDAERVMASLRSMSLREGVVGDCASERRRTSSCSTLGSTS